MGFSAVLKRLPQIFRRIRQTVEAAVAAQPDVVVIIDSPDFTHRVARRIRAAAPQIPIVDYVCPQVWAWRPWRAKAMRTYLEHVLALLPFEPEFLSRLDGPPCTYVGHPLAQQIDELRPNAEEQARREGQPPLVVALPGSRSGEVRALAPVFGEALRLTSERTGPLDVVVPTLPRLLPLVQAQTAKWPLRPRIVTEQHERRAAFRSARAALTKSGTSTLELALAGVPMVAAYKLSPVEALLAQALISVDTVILANLVLGQPVVPELLQNECTPENIAERLVPVIGDTPARDRQVNAFMQLDEIMAIGKAEPSVRAADIVLACSRVAGR